MSRKANLGWTMGLVLGLASIAMRPATAAPLTVGYSDWPGWDTWQIAIDKGWIKEAGIDLTFQWFDYSASMDAFSAGKLDADFLALEVLEALDAGLADNHVVAIRIIGQHDHDAFGPATTGHERIAVGGENAVDFSGTECIQRCRIVEPLECHIKAGLL